MPGPTTPTFRRSGRAGLTAWILLGLVLLTAAGLRVRLLDVPLERDEGEYAYAGQLLLQGVPPYGGIYNMKFPGVYAAFAVTLAVLGQSVAAVRAGLIVVNGATILMLFLLGRRYVGPRAALAGAAAFAWLSSGRMVQGIFANAEHFVLLAAVAGFLVLTGDHRRPGRLFAGGLCLGLACVMKQHGAIFLGFAGLALLVEDLRARSRDGRALVARYAAFAAGAALPLLATAAALAAAGVFDRFWFWTVSYARSYASDRGVQAGLEVLGLRAGRILGIDAPLWILAGVGLAAVWTGARRRTTGPLLTGWLVAAAAATSVGFYFRAHYFLYLLPPAALLCGVGIDALARRLPRPPAAAAAILLLALLFSLVRDRPYRLELGPDAVSRLVYQTNPFPEARAIGEFLRERSQPDDRVFVFGSEPEILFYSGLRSATGYVYMYPLMEEHAWAERMQSSLIEEVEAARPRFLVVVDDPMSWLRTPGSPDRIFGWIGAYAGGDFRRIAVADVVDADETIYHFGEAARGYRPRGSSLVLYERR